jgi:hypothetical protein
MATLSTRTIASSCDRTFPLSVRQDILSGEAGALKEHLVALQAQCMPWEVVLNDSIDMAVHAVLLPTGAHGRVLYFGGVLVEDTHLFEVGTNLLVPMAPSGMPGYNAFCGGHAFLADGRVLVGGGQRQSRDQYGPVPDCVEAPAETGHPHGGMTWGGERSCAIFSPLAQEWSPAGMLNLDPAGNANSGGRWYPTLTTLSNGEVLAVGGHPFLCEAYPDAANQRHSNNTPERYNAQADSWTLLASHPPSTDQKTADDGADDYDYQRNHLLPNGRLFFSSRVRGNNRFYDPFQGVFLNSENFPVIDLPPEGTYQGRFFARYTSVLLPLLHQENYRARVLVANGVTPFPIDVGAETKEWEPVARINWDELDEETPPQRYFACPVLLPTGEVFFSGGTEQDGTNAIRQLNAVQAGEMYNPVIDWDTGHYGDGPGEMEPVDAAEVPRHYHSTALLMPNGTVWTAGSNGPDDEVVNPERRIEIYRPPYCQLLHRPEITASPDRIIYGAAFEVRTSQAASVQRVALIRNGSVTHAFNSDQRYVGLQFSHSGGDLLTVIAPPHSAVAPPGYYMLWIVDDTGRPCKLARFVNVSALSVRITAAGCGIFAPLSLLQDVFTVGDSQTISLREQLHLMQRECLF